MDIKKKTLFYYKTDIPSDSGFEQNINFAIMHTSSVLSIHYSFIYYYSNYIVITNQFTVYVHNLYIYNRYILFNHIRMSYIDE